MPKQRKSGFLRFVLKWPVLFALGLLMAFFLYRSHSIYQIAFGKLGLNGIENTCNTLSIIPFLGGPLFGTCAGVARFITGFLAVSALAGITILESLPALAYFSPGGVVVMVETLRSVIRGRPKLQEEAGDTKAISTLVKRHNSIGESAFRGFVLLSVIAFAVEIWIVFIARGAGANLMMVLVDTFGFEAALCGFLYYKSLFSARPQENVVKYSEWRSRA